MASSKDLFLRNQEDVKAALAVTKAPIFERLIAFARAEMSQINPTADQMLGANKFIEILSSLADEDAEPIGPIESGLKHDLSIPDRTQPPTEKK